jgi:hypothetical protein
MRTSAEYVARLLDRLRLLHECYERAFDDLGLLRVDVVREPRADRRLAAQVVEDGEGERLVRER